MKYTEDDCQEAQVAILTYRRDFKKELMFCAIPNAAKRGYKLASIMKRTGLVAGAPDLIIWQRGRTIQIENKVKGNYQNKNQEAFEAGLKALGHEYHIITATDPNDAVSQLEALL